MKIIRIRLCFPDGDKIIVDKESELVKYNLDNVSSFDVEMAMNREEFDRVRNKPQP